MFSLEDFYKFSDSEVMRCVYPCVTAPDKDTRRAHVRFYDDDRELMLAITPLLMKRDPNDILILAENPDWAEALFEKLVSTLSYLNLKKVVSSYRRMDFDNGTRIYVTTPKACPGVRGHHLQDVFINQAVITQ